MNHETLFITMEEGWSLSAAKLDFSLPRFKIVRVDLYSQQLYSQYKIQSIQNQNSFFTTQASVQGKLYY